MSAELPETMREVFEDLRLQPLPVPFDRVHIGQYKLDCDVDNLSAWPSTSGRQTQISPSSCSSICRNGLKSTSSLVVVAASADVHGGALLRAVAPLFH